MVSVNINLYFAIKVTKVINHYLFLENTNTRGYKKNFCTFLNKKHTFLTILRTSVCKHLPVIIRVSFQNIVHCPRLLFVSGKRDTIHDIELRVVINALKFPQRTNADTIS